MSSEPTGGGEVRVELSARVLGDLQLVDGVAALDVGGARQRRLLAMLVVARGSAVSIDRLVQATFGGDPGDAAWRTLRTYVARLRRVLDAVGANGSDVIVTVPAGYALSRDVTVDADGFETQLVSARDHLDVGEAETALSAVSEALALWSGPAYGEFAQEEWARPDAVRLEELRLVAREVRVGALVECARHDEAIAEALSLLDAFPLREEPRRLLMLGLYRAGRHAEALRAGREFRKLLSEETGLEWSRSLADLERMIIDRDPRLDAVPRGRKLRGYVLGQVLTETPVGATFRATQPSVGREVAITVIAAELADDADFVRRFERHAQRIASIEHPNVVALYDFWREPGGAYLVTRYLTGGTLQELLAADVPMSTDSAITIVDQVGAGLIAAADRGVTHGRLLPAHVLLDEHGGAHLTGFSVDETDDGRARDIAAFADLAAAVWGTVASSVAPDRDVLPADHRALDDVVDRAHAPDGTGYTSLAELRRDLLGAMRGDRTGPSGGGSRDPIEGPNPFRGLRAFRETDVGVFFGRRSIVPELARDLERDGFVALIGPSGSGKSSIARAGLLDAVRDDGVYIASMVPGASPIAELEIALSRVAAAEVPDLAEVVTRPDRLAGVIRSVLPDEGRLVLLIDQLEEAVTMSVAAERSLVFAELARAVRDHPRTLQVVATLRADFLGRLLDDPSFGPLVRDHAHLVRPLDSEELYEAIVEPATAAGVAVEPELAAVLVADAIDAPGSLPLLQFALTELYEHRADGTMTLAAYRRMGGLGAPIAHRAEEVYSALTTEEQRAARRLFTRSISLGEGAEDTRRRVVVSELASVPQEVLDVFGAARLLTFDRDPRTREPTVEVAHEALVHRWPRLRSWLDDDRAGLTILRHLTATSAAWERAGRDSAELYRGSRLAAAEECAVHHADEMTSTERAFLDASAGARDRTVARDRRRTRRLRALASVLGIVAVLAVAAGVVAVAQRDRAESSAAEAERRTADADVQRALAERSASDAARRTIERDVIRLTSEAVSATEDDPDLAILLSLAAYESARQLGDEPSGRVLSAMQHAVQNSRILRRTDDVTGGAAALSPDGSMLAMRSAVDLHRIEVLDSGTGEEIAGFDAGAPVGELRFADDGERLVVLHADDRRTEKLPPFVSAFDTSDFDLTARTTTAARGSAAALHVSPDGRFASADVVGAVVDEVDPASIVWDLDNSDAEPVEHTGWQGGWLPAGPALVLYDDEIRFVDPISGETRAPAMRADGGSFVEVRSLDVRSDGRELLIARPDSVEVWPLGASTPAKSYPPHSPVEGQTWAWYSPPGDRVVLAGGDDLIRVIDLVSDEELSLYGNPNVGSLSMSADGSKLSVAGRAGGTVLWDLTRTGPTELRNLPTEVDVDSIDFDPDGSEVVVVESGPTNLGPRVRRFDVSSADELASANPAAGAGAHVVASPSGLYVSEPVDGSPAVGHIDQPAFTRELDPCDAPRALDVTGRWLVVGIPYQPLDPACSITASRVVDPTTGAPISTTTDAVVGPTEFGPPGTIAAELMVAQSQTYGENREILTWIEVRHVPSGELLGRIANDDQEFWIPFFSSDGRHVTMGSGTSGGYAIDVEQVLDGGSMETAIVLNPRVVDGAPTTFSIASSTDLVTGHSGEELRFHRLETGDEWMTLPVDTGNSTFLRFTPDDRYLYYESRGGVLRRFPMDHRELADLAATRAQREFTAEECERYGIRDQCTGRDGSS